MKYVLISGLYSLPVFLSGAGFISRKFNLPLLLRAFLGSLFVCLLVSPLLFLNVYIVKYLITFLIFLGYILLISQGKKEIRILHILILSKIKKNRLRIMLFLVYFYLFSFLFSDFLPTNYTYTEHDLLYWSWPSELYRANYAGGLRSEIAWPMQFTSYHVFNGVFLSFLNILSPFQTMVGILSQKYLLITCIPAIFLASSERFSNKHILKILLAFSFSLTIFRNEISYSMTNSNYLAVILILICFWVMFQKNDSAKLPTITLVFFLMIFSKLVLFPIALFIFCIYFLKTRNFFSKFENLMLFSLFVFNVYSWIFVKKPQDSKLISPIDFLDIRYIRSIRTLADWLNDPILVGIQFPFTYYFSAAIILFIIVKIFFLFYFSINRIFNYTTQPPRLIFGDNLFSFYATWYLFMILSLVLLICFRTSTNIEIKHSAHLLYTGSLITAFIFGDLLVRSLRAKSSYLFLALILLSVLFVSPYKISNDFSFFSPQRELNDSSLKIESLDRGTFIYPNKIETHVQKQIRSSILGRKIECSEIIKEQATSPIYLFLYLPYNKIC